jgi:hypothetical protein
MSREKLRSSGNLALPPIPPEDCIIRVRLGPHYLSLRLKRILGLSPNNPRSIGLQGIRARFPNPSPVHTAYSRDGIKKKNREKGRKEERLVLEAGKRNWKQIHEKEARVGHIKEEKGREVCKSLGVVVLRDVSPDVWKAVGCQYVI